MWNLLTGVNTTENYQQLMTKIDGFLKSLARIKLKLKNEANSTIKRQRETIRRLKSKIICLERKVETGTKIGTKQ